MSHESRDVELAEQLAGLPIEDGDLDTIAASDLVAACRHPHADEDAVNELTQFLAFQEKGGLRSP